MDKYLGLKTVVLMGRTFDEYNKMFDLDKELLKNEILLDAASGVSSFCAEANSKGFNVTASDKIYYLSPNEIETKCEQDLDSVMGQMPAIADIYLWDFFKDIQSLKANREKAYRSFLEDFKKYGIKRYKPVEYPRTDFRDEQFTMSLVSHLLFLYEDKLDYDFHKKTILELLRISSKEIRIFPIVNLKGIRSRYIELLVHDEDFRNLKISIKRVGYEFMKNANEMMVIRGGNMKSYPGWQYNEMKQVGTDYNDPAQVEVYDSQMGKLRDIKKENEEIIKTLGLTNNQTLIEFGTGTGNFAIDAAKRCEKVFAIDVSPRMLEFAQKKADRNGIKNIEFHNSGFLTYEHQEAPVDAVVSQLALHHLPDFWKLIALKRVFGMLTSGGKFFLKDTVYSFDENTHEAFFNNLIGIIRKAGGAQIADDLETGIRDEYSTLSWIMEALLLRAGFTIDEKKYSEGLIAVYLCTKECTKRE